jgi:large subunit ribosomal protein L29
MKASDIREFSKEELQSRLLEIKKNLFNLKFQKASGQLDNFMKIKSLKKDVARIETVLREKELGLIIRTEEKNEQSKKAKPKSSQKQPKKAKLEEKEAKEETIKDK